MPLRTRVALLIGLTVLIASAVGGIGVAVSSRNLGRDRVDQELVSDVSSATGREFNRLLDLRRNSCDGIDFLASEHDEHDEHEPAKPRPRNSYRRTPEFSAVIQLVSPSGETSGACLRLPVDGFEGAIAETGTGLQFRTVTVGEHRLRMLTVGAGDWGALQVARDLDLSEEVLRGLITRVIGFGAAGAFVAAMVGWFLARRTTEPISELSNAAQRVATTHDLGQRIQVDGTDELAGLATSFNTMLESLDTSREQQRRLVQDASHELRTPLTSIRTNTAMLARHQDMAPDIRDQIHADVEAEIGELTDLIAELVESATEVPGTIGSAVDFNLEATATECVERSRRRFDQTIELEFARPEDPLRAFGAPDLVARALTNLINNAAKFSGGVGPIEVLVARGPGGVTVKVSDHGPGVPSEDLAHIFDRFYRSTQARNEPGSGLGLAIVKQIVDAHGGRVFATNRPAAGLEIGFELPYPEPEPASTD